MGSADGRVAVSGQKDILLLAGGKAAVTELGNLSYWSLVRNWLNVGQATRAAVYDGMRFFLCFLLFFPWLKLFSKYPSILFILDPCSRLCLSLVSILCRCSFYPARLPLP